MSTVTYTRQLGIFDPADHQSAAVSIVGLGGIGSFAAISLAKLGIPQLNLIDFDTVEPHNVPNQFYLIDSVQNTKAAALSDLCHGLAPITATPFIGRLDKSGFTATAADATYSPTPIMISGLDSMAARAEVWEYVRLNTRIRLYLDARIAGQLIVIYATNPIDLDSIDAYERTLHSDDDAVPAACTERGVIDVGMIVGGLLTRLVRAHYAGEDINPVTLMNLESLTLNTGEWVL